MTLRLPYDFILFAVLPDCLAAFTRIFVMIWPFFTVLAVFAAYRFGMAWRKHRRLMRSTIEDIDRMDPRQFEEVLEALFRQTGHQIERNRSFGDYGGGLVLSRDGVRTVVQAKRCGKRVGIRAIQEAMAAKGLYGCARALIVTNHRYTDQAREMARRCDVDLWDREALIAVLLSIRIDAVPPSVTPWGKSVELAPASESRSSDGSKEMAMRAAPGEHLLGAGHHPPDQRESCKGAAAVGVGDTKIARCQTCGKPVSGGVAAYGGKPKAPFDGSVHCPSHRLESRVVA